MELEKLITINKLFDVIIGGLIAEFDIKHAGATAMLELKGLDVYEYLMKLDKKTRNIKIGLMMRAEPGLSESVNELMLKYLNMFIRENKIKSQNIIYTTRDSIVVYNKLPLKTTFDHVEFSNKDGMYSSMYRIKNLTILFDSMSGKVDIKGISDDIVKNSDFLNKFLIKHLFTIESCQKSGDEKVFNVLRYMREDYLKSQTNSIYRDIMHENKLGVRYNNELIYLDNDLDNEDDDTDDGFSIAKDLNYMSILLPIMRSVLVNG